MKTITLNHGRVTLVDNVDYEWLNQWKWRVSRSGCGHTFYATRWVYATHGKRRNEHMHRLILGLPPRSNGQETDHRDGDGLNNQRANLRACTTAENQHSQRKHKRGTSKYKGVRWFPTTSKWQARIQVNGKRVRLGYFNLETDAATAYDYAALKYFGDFALTNEMLKGEEKMSRAP